MFTNPYGRDGWPKTGKKAYTTILLDDHNPVELLVALNENTTDI
jgi:hypothetical protein